MSKFRFRCKGHKQFICDPRGKPVIRYWNCWFGRLGNLREFNAEFVSDGTTIICTHGGLARSLLSYLNTGQFSEPHHTRELYDGERTLKRLDELRTQQ